MPAIFYTLLSCQCCTTKQIDLTSVLLLYSCLIVSNECKSAPAQIYQHSYYLVPPQSLSRKQIKSILTLCKPLFIVHGRIKAF